MIQSVKLEKEHVHVCINHPVMLFTVYRIMVLQKEKEQQSEQFKQTLQKFQAKHETDMSHLHQEHALSAAKVHFTHCTLPLQNILLLFTKYLTFYQI